MECKHTEGLLVLTTVFVVQFGLCDTGIPTEGSAVAKATTVDNLDNGTAYNSFYVKMTSSADADVLSELPQSAKNNNNNNNNNNIINNSNKKPETSERLVDQPRGFTPREATVDMATTLKPLATKRLPTSDVTTAKPAVAITTEDQEDVDRGGFLDYPGPGPGFYDDDDDYDDDEEEEIPVEQLLMNKLLYNYERSVRPVKNASDTVLVKMGLTMTQIFDMHEKNQVLVTNVWLDQEWDDMFLVWDPDEFGGLRTFRLPCHKIWLPDIVLYNNAAAYTDGLMPANAMITFEGNVFWPVPTKLQSSCKVDVTYFPFDEQHCKLKFGSWTYDGFQVDMTNRTSDVDLSNYVQNGEWELVRIDIQRNVVYYACCKEPFPDVTFIVHIRRRTIYYLYNVIFPCIMMSALTLLVFCLPPDSGEKITMGITVLLAFSVFLLRMGEDLPETSEFIPLLSIYLTTVMAMTSLSIIMTVFVLNLHYRGPNDSPVPPWLRKIFLRKKVAKGLCFRKDSRFVEEYLSDSQTHYVKNVSLRMTIENLAQELKEELDNCTSDFTSETPSSNTERCDPNSYEAPPNEQSRRHQYYMRQTGARTNEEVLSALRKIIERYEKDDSDEEVMYEWRQVALGVDKILFWIFFIGTLFSTVVVLIVAPITKWM